YEKVREILFLSKIDKAKEKIAILKFWLGIAVATFLAIIGWSVTNYSKIEVWLLILGFFAMIILGIAIVFLSRLINKKIDELEDL
ncbi:MAG: hypothetical protein J1E28_07690, partial [Helicobacter sp.]|uniref:hypothetical protein n=1 Tax=Helicobacter sp. TaxID=218 RepID=UPI0025BFCE88